ncbi:MAG: hypothetical protein AMXMBFR13_40810 [Phycisphaerae bacterium]
MCPVSGRPVNADAATTHAGQKVWFCSSRCVDLFQTSPAKYLHALYRQLYPQQVQVTCPVMGGVIEPAIWIQQDDGKVLFCCKECSEKYQSSSTKYWPKLRRSYTSQVHCPFSGDPINPAYSLEEQGRRVFFCSPECIPEYQKQQSWYANALLPEVGLLAYGPVATDDLVLCLVCLPGAAEHKRGEVQMAVYRGKVYFLSSEACIEAFKANPTKYGSLASNTPRRPTAQSTNLTPLARSSLLRGRWGAQNHAQHAMPRQSTGRLGHGGGISHGGHTGCH